jgi:putative hydrolase of the HAD superfamily
MKVIVFDLDDTLYEELTYVTSGFRAVASYLKKHYNIDEKQCLEKMLLLMEKNGRGSIFDDILETYTISSKQNITKCLSVYRSHIPNIKLFDDAKDCLKRLANYPKYIVTDGNKVVQKIKLEKLQLNLSMKRCFITHQYGKENAKPSPHCFLKIAEIEKVPFEEIIYIGDNPNKDFVGIKPLGFKTIRIMRGNYKNVIMPEKYNADKTITTLNELII